MANIHQVLDKIKDQNHDIIPVSQQIQSVMDTLVIQSDPDKDQREVLGSYWILKNIRDCIKEFEE